MWRFGGYTCIIHIIIHRVNIGINPMITSKVKGHEMTFPSLHFPFPNHYKVELTISGFYERVSSCLSSLELHDLHLFWGKTSDPL